MVVSIEYNVPLLENILQVVLWINKYDISCSILTIFIEPIETLFLLGGNKWTNLLVWKMLKICSMNILWKTWTTRGCSSQWSNCWHLGKWYRLCFCYFEDLVTKYNIVFCFVASYVQSTILGCVSYSLTLIHKFNKIFSGKITCPMVLRTGSKMINKLMLSFSNRSIFHGIIQDLAKL
jgi:hypothetical protein